MSDLNLTIIQSHRERMGELHRRAAAVIERLSDEDLNWRPNPECNSIANLVIHLEGNFRQRMLHGLLGQPDTRDRDAEFEPGVFVGRDQLLQRLNQAFGMVNRVLAELGPDRLGEPQQIRDRQMTLVEVLLVVTSHAAEHTGQMIYIGKLRLGSEFPTLSIPRKG